MPEDEPDYKKDGEVPPYDEYEEQIIKQVNPWDEYKPNPKKFVKEIIKKDGTVTD